MRSCLNQKQIEKWVSCKVRILFSFYVEKVCVKILLLPQLPFVKTNIYTTLPYLFYLMVLENFPPFIFIINKLLELSKSREVRNQKILSNISKLCKFDTFFTLLI